ncbi:D-alanyl-lipoteichoic acid biosynthesis protein DltD [Lactobacillus sp. DCY120]|uniref:Protein DltD n=1 Tax=Bombilactobacillus apium TaxID=2675299 RepID=A0A850R9C6_9LACO|nr:D-alanyl-lipoteichoic acid biosynthesis protein DltD [Bombilactobacillus apium]NVY97125.1 D-alanyl-lipoteichoic acid biosynthesis protein DltD [Bombilactobacillus apium]
MNNGKKLFGLIGPMITAGLLVLLVLFGPFHLGTPDAQTEKRAATSLSANVLRGDQIKRNALDRGYLMMMGSSELSRFDTFHPSVLTEKYPRGYHPFLLGEAGTQSLTHFFSTQMMGNKLDHKRVVVVISPQWFVKEGVEPEAFGFYYSKQQAINFINHANPQRVSDRYAAQRLLKMTAGSADPGIQGALQRIKAGKEITAWQYFSLVKVSGANLRQQDQLFTRFGIMNREPLLEHRLRSLPDDYNYPVLDQMAIAYGREHTSNNDFMIHNRFYNRKIRKIKNSLKDSQKGFSYEYGPEYSDFQLLLTQFKKHHVQPLFVITPVNSRWMAYTGLSQAMLNRFDRKINYQLQTQGFNQILDLHQQGKIPYFMQDTIHLGWRGWLQVDRRIHNFVQQPMPKNLNYQLRDYFYTKSWQQHNPRNLPNAE